MTRVFEIGGHRDHHVANVTSIRKPVAVNPAHPSVRAEMFDQDQAPADQSVRLTRIEAQLIASLLKVARNHLPSPRAVDQAIELLTGER